MLSDLFHFWFWFVCCPLAVPCHSDPVHKGFDMGSRHSCEDYPLEPGATRKTLNRTRWSLKPASTTASNHERAPCGGRLGYLLQLSSHGWQTPPSRRSPPDEHGFFFAKFLPEKGSTMLTVDDAFELLFDSFLISLHKHTTHTTRFLKSRILQTSRHTLIKRRGSYRGHTCGLCTLHTK